MLHILGIKKKLLEDGDELGNYLELIIWFIKKLKLKFYIEFNNVYTIEDAFMDGILAYYDAKKNYDSKKAKFSTYLYFHVWNRVLRGYKKSSIVRVPLNSKNSYILNDRNIISFENMSHMFDNHFTCEKTSHGDLDKFIDIYFKKELEDRFFENEVNDIIEHSLHILTPVQRKVFCSFFGFKEEEKTVLNIAKDLDVTKTAIYYSLETSIKKIKEYLNLEFPSIFNLVNNLGENEIFQIDDE